MKRCIRGMLAAFAVLFLMACAQPVSALYDDTPNISEYPSATDCVCDVTDLGTADSVHVATLPSAWSTSEIICTARADQNERRDRLLMSAYASPLERWRRSGRFGGADC